VGADIKTLVTSVHVPIFMLIDENPASAGFNGEIYFKKIQNNNRPSSPNKTPPIVTVPLELTVTEKI
jgi:hypothetical protein